MSTAPIALFVYNRPEHTRRTVEHLLANDLAGETDVYVFADGPKQPDAPGVAEVRAYIRSVTGFRALYMIPQPHNVGMTRSIIAGLDFVCRAHGRVIMIEDDLCVAPHFLRYMNDALDLYEHDDGVISINGYTYPIAAAADDSLPETFFIRGADCWGCATWQRGLALFEEDGRKLLDEILRRDLAWEFDCRGTYPYTKMLLDHVEGRVNSWTIRWYASAFLRNKLTLYPRRSLVVNIGHDDSGTHCGTTDVYDTALPQHPVRVERIPIAASDHFTEQFAAFFRRLAGRAGVTVEEALAAIQRLCEAGRLDEARSYCQAVLDVLPDHPGARRMAQQLQALAGGGGSAA